VFFILLCGHSPHLWIWGLGVHFTQYRQNEHTPPPQTLHRCRRTEPLLRRCSLRAPRPKEWSNTSLLAPITTLPWAEGFRPTVSSTPFTDARWFTRSLPNLHGTRSFRCFVRTTRARTPFSLFRFDGVRWSWADFHAARSTGFDPISL